MYRFLLTWTSFLPFALYSRFQWLTPFVSAIITFLLFGVSLFRSLTIDLNVCVADVEVLPALLCDFECVWRMRTRKIYHVSPG